MKAPAPLSTSPTEDPAELEIGRVGRPHGLRGEVFVHAVTNRPERFAAGSELHWGARSLVVEAARLHGGRWVVAFAGVLDRDEAEALRGAVLTAPPLGDLPEGEYWVHELVGAVLVDANGLERGRVAHVEANPASDLLVLDGGGMVPVVFVRSVEPGRVVADLPPGLLD